MKIWLSALNLLHKELAKGTGGGWVNELRHEAEESTVPSHRALLLCLWMLSKLKRRASRLGMLAKG